ncbi:MAG: NRAMP family divalent metal transporter [Acidimicrobiales bacterium]
MAPAAREEHLRRRDQARVGRARAGGRHLRVLWLVVGPGILVLLGENDGPSMLSYAATGALYGVGFFLPFIVVTFAVAFVVQEMAMRLGVVTGVGQATLVFRRFGPRLGRSFLATLVLGNVLTLVAELVAVQAGLAYFGVPRPAAVAAGVAVVLAALGLRRYRAWERGAMILALGNLCFVPAALLGHPHLGAVASALGTWSPLPPGSGAVVLTLVLADIGATVTPWMVFFQQAAVADKGLTAQDLRAGRIDTAVGGGLAALVAVATVVAAAALFTHHGLTGGLSHSADFATALRPYLGHAGATLFAVGLVEAGLLAAVMISVASSYVVGEMSRQAHSLNRSFREAPLFYATALLAVAVAAAAVLVPGAPLLLVTVVANVVATVLMPATVACLLVLVNDRRLMGAHANGRAANLVAGAVVAALTAAVAAYLVLGLVRLAGG